MFVQARKVTFLDDVKFDTTFQNGKIIRYDMSKLFQKYPQLIKLREDRNLFLSGKLDSVGWAIIWNDDLDFSTTSVYYEGEVVGYETPTLNDAIGALLIETANKKHMSQSDVARKSGINQADIWRLECGKGNPTLAKIDKVFKALGVELKFKAK